MTPHLIFVNLSLQTGVHLGTSRRRDQAEGLPAVGQMRTKCTHVCSHTMPPNECVGILGD